MSFEDSSRCFAFEKTKDAGGTTVGYKFRVEMPRAAVFPVRQKMLELWLSPRVRVIFVTFSWNEFKMNAKYHSWHWILVEEAAPKCKFPNWFSSHHWHSLDGKQLVRFYHKNTTFHVLNENCSVPTNNKCSVSTTAGISNFLVAGARLSCLNIKETSGGRHVAILVHYLLGWWVLQSVHAKR